MKIFIEHYPHIGGPFAVSIGKFDGVHIGHKKILDALLEEARAHSAVSLVYSFEPREDVQRLTTPEEKIMLFEALGVDTLVMAELTAEFRTQPPERFIERLMACGQLKAIVVGDDFRFGQGASGNVELLNRIGNEFEFRVRTVGQVEMGGKPVSSTLIRDRVKAGDVETAAGMLGRSYSIGGEVAHGRRLGTQMGFKTANLLPPEGKLLPANGVYAAYVDTDAGTYPAMTNIGVNPTVNGQGTTIESHLLGFDGDLYGKSIAVRFVKRIRDEIRFEGIGQLEEQMAHDKITVLKLLE
jgi:riboflavin kinase/FMN adenylyltransferase